MNLHQFITSADAAGYLITVDREVDPYLEVARLAAENDGRPMLVQSRQGQAYPVVAGVCSDRRYFGLALGVPADQVMFRLAEALTPGPSPNLGRGEPTPSSLGRGSQSPPRIGGGGRPARKWSSPKSTWRPSPS